MKSARRCLPAILALGSSLAGPVLASPDALAGSEDEIPPADFLTFAEGAFPVSVTTFGAGKPVGLPEVMAMIDGDPRGLTVVSQAGAEGGVEIVYELPALTTFERFAVPSVLETPSPSQTFFRNVAVAGSAGGPEGPWQPLATATLETHHRRGETTGIEPSASLPVRWVKLRLWGGIESLRDPMFYEFSEIVGNGTQEAVPLSDAFRGIWKGRGVLIELRQEGAVVSGCVDREGDPFEGTVSGNLLRGRAVDRKSGVESLFVLAVAPDGNLEGVRSTNGAPFRRMSGQPAPAGTKTACSESPAVVLGCDSVIHGIRFGFDSAKIRPESEPILKQLHEGLASNGEGKVVIEGHTSSEGSTEYNQDLSERRARAVVDDLVRRGIDEGRIEGVGRGESTPIAPNDTESGRSLNRRVEVHCP